MLHEPLADLVPKLPLHESEPSPNVMELPLIEPWYAAPLGVQDIEKLHPLCEMVQAVSGQVPLSVQLPE